MLESSFKDALQIISYLIIGLTVYVIFKYYEEKAEAKMKDYNEKVVKPLAELRNKSIKLVNKYKKEFEGKGIKFYDFIKMNFTLERDPDVKKEDQIIDTILYEIKRTSYDEVEEVFKNEMKKYDEKRLTLLYFESIKPQLSKKGIDINKVEKLINQGTRIDELKQMFQTEDFTTEEVKKTAESYWEKRIKFLKSSQEYVEVLYKVEQELKDKYPDNYKDIIEEIQRMENEKDFFKK